jgi:transketolase
MKLSYVESKYFEELLSLEINPILKNKLISDMCRINILYMICYAGSGHIGSSFSSIDIMNWALGELNKNYEKLYFFSSKGHDAPALYNSLIAYGKLNFSLLSKLRKIDGLPGHPDINTPNIFTNTGSLGMGISKSKGIIKANRLKGINSKVIVLTGDGELQEGQIWESLNRVSQEELNELIIVVDNNKFQSDRTVKITSDLGDIENKFKSFGIETVSCDGNSVEEFSKAFESIESRKKPGAIIANTVKGFGVSFMHGDLLKEGEFYKFHSGSIAQEIFDKAILELNNKITKSIYESKIKFDFKLSFNDSPDIAKKDNIQQSLLSSYSNSIVNEARKNKKIIALDGDLILDTGLIEFEKKFPERFIECGIAEQDMVSQAGTLAKEGFIPIVHSFSSFLTARPNEQIYNNSTEETKVIYSGFLAGLLPSGPGHSHQAVRDIASMSGMHNLEMIQPNSEKQVEKLLKYSLESPNNIYIRFCSIPFELPDNFDELSEIKKGFGNTISDGKDICILTYSPTILSEAIKSKSLLLKNDINPKLISMPWLNTFDNNWIINELNNFHLIIIEDHYIEGGVAEKLALAISKLDLNIKVDVIGITEVPKSGTNQEILDYHGLSFKKISKKIMELIKT